MATRKKIGWDLTRQDLEEYPVWCPDETQENLQPVLNPEPLPDDLGLLLVKADFETADGLELAGYVVVDESVYVVNILLDDHDVGFNANLPDMAQEDLELLRQELGRPTMRVFPLRYRAEFHFDREGNIEGMFDPFADRQV